jgi:hypothetical protein
MLYGPFEKLNLTGTTFAHYFNKFVLPAFTNRKFGGSAETKDIRGFRAFMKRFQLYVGKFDIPVEDKMFALQEVLGERALKSVDHLLSSSHPEAYREALQILFTTYGDPLQEDLALRQQLDLIKPLSTSYIDELNYVLQLRKARARFEDIGTDPDEACSLLISKALHHLPGNAVAQYREKYALTQGGKFWKGQEQVFYQDIFGHLERYFRARMSVTELQRLTSLEIDPCTLAILDGGVAVYAGSQQPEVAPSSVGNSTQAGGQSTAPAPGSGHAQKQGGSSAPTEIAAMAATGAGPAQPPPEEKADQSKNGRAGQRGSRARRERKKECKICLSKDHYTEHCPLDVNEKTELLKKYDKCFNCLNTGHRAQDCRTKHNCFYCKAVRKQGEPLPSKHHTFVCYAKYSREQKVGRQAENRSYRSTSRRSYAPRPSSTRQSSRHPQSGRDERADRRDARKSEQAGTRPSERQRQRSNATAPVGSSRAGTRHRAD